MALLLSPSKILSKQFVLKTNSLHGLKIEGPWANQDRQKLDPKPVESLNAGNVRNDYAQESILLHQLSAERKLLETRSSLEFLKRQYHEALDKVQELETQLNHSWDENGPQVEAQEAREEDKENRHITFISGMKRIIHSKSADFKDLQREDCCECNAKDWISSLDMASDLAHILLGVPVKDHNMEDLAVISRKIQEECPTVDAFLEKYHADFQNITKQFYMKLKELTVATSTLPNSSQSDESNTELQLETMMEEETGLAVENNRCINRKDTIDDLLKNCNTVACGFEEIDRPSSKTIVEHSNAPDALLDIESNSDFFDIVKKGSGLSGEMIIDLSLGDLLDDDSKGHRSDPVKVESVHRQTCDESTCVCDQTIQNIQLRGSHRPYNDPIYGYAL